MHGMHTRPKIHCEQFLDLNLPMKYKVLVCVVGVCAVYNLSRMYLVPRIACSWLGHCVRSHVLTMAQMKNIPCMLAGLQIVVS